MQLEFPITVYFEEDRQEWVFSDEIEAACTLEWFDSDDLTERAIVRDNKGRPIRLKVKKLNILICELAIND